MQPTIKNRPGAFFLNILTALVSLLLCFLILEAGIRVAKGKLFDTTHILNRKIELLKGYYPVAYDPLLGWVPKKNSTAGDELWIAKKTSITEEGLRSNGVPVPAEDRPIVLAVGDSYTFGDRVSDSETWPSQLERMSRFRVLNGGVFGYGVDQMVLRAEELLKSTDPKYVIVNFIYDDVARCQLSVRNNAPKPFFDIADGRLVLKNVPVPKIEPNIRGFMTPVHKILGYSYLANSIMIRYFPEFWLLGKKSMTQEHERGELVAQTLLSNFADKMTQKGIRTLLVYSGDGSKRDWFDHFVQSGNLAHLQILNGGRLYGDLISSGKYRRGDLFDVTNHPTPLAHNILAVNIQNILEETN